MKIIDPSYKILTPINGHDILRIIEKAGRICYKSEGKISIDSHVDLVKNLIKRGHESVLEHFNITIHFICNRGFSHELVRHRLASYSQESTRYCNYSQEKFGKEITIIKPWWIKNKGMDGNIIMQNIIWEEAMQDAEKRYFHLLRRGLAPQEARGVLPIDLKTEIIITTNLREWRHILKLRTSKAAHPSMRELMIPLLEEFQKRIPVVFGDI